ncbi:MAG TPA: hypothetical protein VFX06_06310, partial [Stellaceae bacterium]|nr:hypothetical protein [Stellaceae bacterium]
MQAEQVNVIPQSEDLTICFAHVTYQLAARFALRRSGVAHFEVRTAKELRRRIGEADVLVVSGLWQNELL